MPRERFKEWYDKVYLRSDYWKELRQRVVDALGARCRRCGSATDHVVHHRTYLRLCREELSDLEVLCWNCHQTIHVARRLGLPEAVGCRNPTGDAQRLLRQG
jgi:5-methylcytosine-specific restriction endonuclease McrA